MEDSAPIVPEAPTRLWLPGLGVVDPAIRRVVKAVRDYDPDLKLARHEVTGDWVVTLREDSYPIYGFGRELPRPDDVAHILGERDVKRNGKRILDQIRRQAELQKKEDEYRVDEGEGMVAEQMAHFYAKHGERRTPRIFVPRGVS